MAFKRLLTKITLLYCFLIPKILTDNILQKDSFHLDEQSIQSLKNALIWECLDDFVNDEIQCGDCGIACSNDNKVGITDLFLSKKGLDDSNIDASSFEEISSLNNILLIHNNIEEIESVETSGTFTFWVDNNFIKSDDDKINSYENCTVIPNEDYCVLHNSRCVFNGKQCAEREDYPDDVKILFDDFCEFITKLNHPELCYLNCHSSGGICYKNEKININMKGLGLTNDDFKVIENTNFLSELEIENLDLSYNNLDSIPSVFNFKDCAYNNIDMSFNYIKSKPTVSGKVNTAVNINYNPLTECTSCNDVIKASPDECSLYNEAPPFAPSESNSGSSSSASSSSSSGSGANAAVNEYTYWGCNLHKSKCYFNGESCVERGAKDSKEVVIHLSLSQLTTSEYLNIKRDPLNAIFGFDSKETASATIGSVYEDFSNEEANITIRGIPPKMYNDIINRYTEYATVCVNIIGPDESSLIVDDPLTGTEIGLIFLVIIFILVLLAALGFLGFATFRFIELPPDPSAEKWLIEPQKATFGHHGTQIDVLKEEKQVIKITSYADYMYKLNYKIVLPDGGEKYKLTANKTEGVLKPEETDEITLTVFLNCTYSIHDSIIIEFTYPQKGQIVKGRAEVKIVVQGKLSTKLDSDDLKLDNCLSNNAKNEVYAGHWKSTAVAIKKMKYAENEAAKREFDRTVEVLDHLRSTYFVTFYGAVITPTKHILVNEWMPHGHLEDVTNSFAISPQMKMRIGHDISKAVGFLHGSGIIFRDIRPTNIYLFDPNLDASVVCKLTNFGLSRNVDKKKNWQIEEPLPPGRYTAPEAMSGTNAPYGLSADIYSIGMTFYQLWEEKVPFKDHSIDVDYVNVIKSGKRPKITATEFPEIEKLIKRCWNTDPAERPDCKEIGDVFFDEIDKLAKANGEENKLALYR